MRVKRNEVTKRGARATKEAAEKRATALRTFAGSSATIAGAAQISPDKPLTTAQRDFAKYWAEGDTPVNAALRAGYAKSAAATYATRLRVMPNILRAYHAEKAKYEEAGQMTRKKVMDMLVDAYDMARLATEPASMVSAAREIGRMCGYYEPQKVKIDLNVSGSVMMRQLTAMSDAELLKIIEEGTAPETPLLSDDGPTDE